MDERNIDVYVKMLIEIDEIDQRIRDFGITESSWYESRALRDLLLMPLVQIGELSAHLKGEGPAIDFPSIPWRNIKGFRNVVVHGYGHIDPSIAWETATAGVAELREALLGNETINARYHEEIESRAHTQSGSGSLLDQIRSLPKSED